MTPLQTIRMGVLYARVGLGLAVMPTLPDYGIRRAPDPYVVPHWRVDEHEALSPIGCAIIVMQPRASLATLLAAACESLGVTPGYVAGFDDGCAHREPDPAWTEGDDRQLYMAAFNDGIRIREMLDT